MRTARCAPSLVFLGSVLGATALLDPSDARAQSAEDLDRARARALAGVASLEAKAYATALSECEDALRVIDAPTILLCKARALVGLDRLDDARATYRQLLAKPIPSSAPPAWKEALQSAEAEQREATKLLLDRHGKRMQEQLDAKDFSGALASAERSLGLERTASAALGRARALAGIGRHADAQAAYDDTLALLEKPGTGSGLSRAEVEGEKAKQREAAAAALLTNGEKRIAAGDFTGALETCKASRNYAPTPQADLCIGRGLAGAGQLNEAVAHFDQLLAGGASRLTESQRAEATKERDHAKRKLGPARLSLKVTPLAGLRVAIDATSEQDLTGDKAFELPRGSHTVRLAAPGHVPVVETLELTGGEERAMPVGLRPLPPLRLTGWITLGVGIAALGASGILASQVVSQNNALTAACTGTLECGPSQEPAIQNLSAMRLGTFVAGGVGVAALLASGTLHLLAPSDRMPDAPTVALGLNGLTVSGAF
jgi:tetratricopeptide (TPR) repeat protein